MNTCTLSLRHSAPEKLFTDYLLALTTLLLSLFCASTVQASDDERYERYRGREVKMYGVIDSMPSSGLTGKWVVGGRHVEVTDRTEIEEEHDRAAVGRPVEIEGYRDNDRLIAHEIEVERSRRHRRSDR
ncbi:DUF5666 domain-containing protein [Candidatus Electrothrix sp.]|uniref:DUF5666 domain-containing protein n=1 Tax=Candidatus Electrothrix sp. TaxID=2170559 RepID=UPI00405619B0